MKTSKIYIVKLMIHLEYCYIYRAQGRQAIENHAYLKFSFWICANLKNYSAGENHTFEKIL